MHKMHTLMKDCKSTIEPFLVLKWPSNSNFFYAGTSGNLSRTFPPTRDQQRTRGPHIEHRTRPNPRPWRTPIGKKGEGVFWPRAWSLRNTNTLQMSSLLSRVITDLDATTITTTNCCATNSNHATATGNWGRPSFRTTLKCNCSYFRLRDLNTKISIEGITLSLTENIL